MKYSQAISMYLLSIAASSAALFMTDQESARHIHPEVPTPEPYKISYEDGSESPSIRLKVIGELFESPNIYEETLDGFTVGPRTKNNGGGSSNKKYYTYRDVNLETGDLFDTGLIVGKVDPQSNKINKHAATKSAQIKKKKKENRRTLNHLRGPAQLQVFEEEYQSHRRAISSTGTMKNLVVPFKFSDHATRTVPSRSDLDILMNSVGPATQCPTGSVRDVFKQSSYNTLDVQSTVVEWITIDYTEAECANNNSGLTTFTHTCLVNALDKLRDSGSINFADFDVDGNGLMDGMTFFHSGYAAEWGGTDAYGATTADRMWSHKWAIYTTNWSSNGVRVYDYHINPSVWGRSGTAIGRIGVVAHETGHFLGLPDLYDYGDATYGDGNGIGSWGLMANSWGFDGSQLYPPLMSAWGKEQLGWVNPTIVSTSGTYSLGQACDNSDVIKITEGYPSGEYLLIENRQPCGFETAMPQGGLAIFHIDTNANNIRGYPGQTGWPENGNHYRVAVLQADANYNLEKNNNRGDSGDAFHAGGVSSIGPSGTSTGATYPNTKAYQNGIIVDTFVTISNISAAGATMTFDITFGGNPTATPTATPTASPTVTVSPTATPTATATASPTVTASPSASPTITVTVNCNGINVKSQCNNFTYCKWSGNPKNGSCSFSATPPPAPTPIVTPAPSPSQCPVCGNGDECCPSLGRCETSGNPRNRRCLLNRRF